MHLKGPRLLFMFIQIETVPQQMRSAHTVLTGVLVHVGVNPFEV